MSNFFFINILFCRRRSIGVSNFNKDQIERVLAAGTVVPAANQVGPAYDNIFSCFGFRKIILVLEIINPNDLIPNNGLAFSELYRFLIWYC